jgi:hypothetical protein
MQVSNASMWSCFNLEITAIVQNPLFLFHQKQKKETEGMVSKRLKTASTRWNWYKARKTEPSWQHHGRESHDGICVIFGGKYYLLN